MKCGRRSSAVALAGIVWLGATAPGCREPRFDNCADPAAPCAASEVPAPKAGARLINDFEAAPAPASSPLGCSALFAGERCTLPLKNQLGQCADSLFCAHDGSVCGSPVEGADAFRGRSWRLRFNESLIGDASVSGASGADGSSPADGVGYPFSGYSERLSSVLAQGPGCDGSQPPFDASGFVYLTFWVKVDDNVDFEMALKSDRVGGPDAYPESFPKVALGDCRSWSPSCICEHHLAWQKVCLPLTKLQTTASPQTQVNLSRLVEVNFAFAASPYVVDRHERAAADIVIDDLTFEGK